MFSFNPERVRKDFPVLNKGIIYFDSACMSLKPRQVVEKMNEYYFEYPACGGRSEHKLSQRVELEVAKVRQEIRKMIGARKDSEIIFVRNATEGINLVANGISWNSGDEIIISDKEHNSNLISWLKLKSLGVKIIVCKSNVDGTFNFGNFEKCFSSRTRLVSFVHISNLDGVANPVEKICSFARKKNVLSLVDGAQSFPHSEIDVQKIGCDFFVLSGHKALGPTGVGVLFGRREILESLGQFIVGGQTVKDSTYNSYEIEELPKKFEAGLQDYAGIIGFGEACRYLRKVGLKNIEKHVSRLNDIVSSELNDLVEVIGPKNSSLRSGIFSFIVNGVNSHDVAKMIESSKGIAVRSGAFCVHSWFNFYEKGAAVRASFYFYNTEEEVRIFVEEIKKILKFVS